MKAETLVGALMALVLAMAALPRPAQAEGMKDVSCNGFDLSYAGQAATIQRLELHQYGNQTEVQVKRLIIKAASYEMIVTYLAGQFHTYFPIKPLRDQIDNGGYFRRSETPLGIGRFDRQNCAGLRLGAAINERRRPK